MVRVIKARVKAIRLGVLRRMRRVGKRRNMMERMMLVGVEAQVLGHAQLFASCALMGKATQRRL